MSQPNSSGYVPASALSADSKVGNIALKISIDQSPEIACKLNNHDLDYK